LFRIGLPSAVDDDGIAGLEQRSKFTLTKGEEKVALADEVDQLFQLVGISEVRKRPTWALRAQSNRQPGTEPQDSECSSKSLIPRRSLLPYRLPCTSLRLPRCRTPASLPPRRLSCLPSRLGAQYGMLQERRLSLRLKSTSI